MNTLHPVQILQANIGNLSERDKTFALSLLNSRTLSQKQHYWIGVLADRATAPKAAPVSTEVGDIAPIVRLIEQAKSKLKWPALVIDGLRITVSGPAAREPGSITVCAQDRRNAEGRRVWLGRITQAGQFEPSRALQGAAVAQVTDSLRQFAADPVGEARKQGHRTGHCCFCQRKLDDERSTALGFGPVCAKNWGLEWNKASAKLVCEEAGA